MEMDRTSIVVLAILVSPFSIIFLIKDCFAALAMSLTGGLGEKSRRTNSSLSHFFSFSALVSAFLRAAAAVFLGGMLDWDWGREITGGWLYLTSSENLLTLLDAPPEVHGLSTYLHKLRRGHFHIATGHDWY